MRPILLLTLAITSSLPLAAQSPMFRGDPAHTGVYAGPDKPIQGRIKWSYEAFGWELYRKRDGMDARMVWPVTPAVVEGRIYFCAGPWFVALDEAGQLLYRTDLGACTLASPAVSDGLSFVATDDGKLRALDIRDGTERWTALIGKPGFLHQIDNWDVFQSSPVVSGGVVYIGSEDGAIYAVAAIDGSVKWRFQTNQVVRATPAVVEGRVFCGSFDGKVYALDAATGKQVWVVDTAVPGVPWHAVQGSCAVMDGIVCVGSRSAFLYGIDAVTGQVRWKHSHDGSWVPSSPAVRDGVAYVGQSDGNKVVAVDATGKRLWEFNAPNETFASPALAGEVLYVAGNDNYNLKGKGTLCALDRATGHALWTLEFPGSVWASPVVAGSAVYVACADGKLYAVE